MNNCYKSETENKIGQRQVEGNIYASPISVGDYSDRACTYTCHRNCAAAYFQKPADRSDQYDI